MLGPTGNAYATCNKTFPFPSMEKEEIMLSQSSKPLLTLRFVKKGLFPGSRNLDTEDKSSVFSLNPL